MIDLILFILLLGGFFLGLKRGLILQVFHLTGFIVAFLVAYLYFDQLAPHLKLWIPYPMAGEEGVGTVLETLNVESVYYRGIAFAMLFFGTKLVMQIIGSMLDFLADLPILRTINAWLGGALGFLEIYLVIFLVLYIAAIVPAAPLQQAFEESVIASNIVKHTPIFSDKLQELWMNHLA
ncbi:CvpA family protein [Bacillus taeanensis]|uniref:CvpA family protein n=1 Tax=Bacillus taeanensis TaxID=273032 RepID=A0A366Y117_9BACI|nr:CvpA family protein [Bacillus taeanensis]RBW71528.1 hypothetical protein DS031_01910 [Bacillus taeanensis]